MNTAPQKPPDTAIVGAGVLMVRALGSRLSGRCSRPRALGTRSADALSLLGSLAATTEAERASATP